MYIFSEKLNKKFDTVEACVAAEKEYDKQVEEAKAKKAALTAERSARAKKVEEAYKKVSEANKAYKELLNQFCKDYGSFHMTLKNVDPFISLFDNPWFF